MASPLEEPRIDADEYSLVDSVFYSLFPGLENQHTGEMNSGDSEFLQQASSRELVEFSCTGKPETENDVAKNKPSRKRSRKSERLNQVQSTIPIVPYTSIQANASHIYKGTALIEKQAESKDVEQSMSPAEETELEEVEGGHVAKKMKTTWKDVGYDELSKICRAFSSYEKSLYEFAGEFAEFSYKVHPFWLGRAHVFEAKQSALEFLYNVVTSSAQAHGNSLREMRQHLMQIPFFPGSFQNGNKIISSHPTEEYTTRRLVNAVEKLGKTVSMDDLLTELQTKQRLIDAKQVCESFQVVNAGISSTPKSNVGDSKSGEIPKPMSFAEFKENYFMLIKSFFDPHDKGGFSKASAAMRNKVGLEITRSVVAFMSGEFRSYTSIYSTKNNPKLTRKSVDSSLREHTKNFKVNFQKFMQELGKPVMFE